MARPIHFQNSRLPSILWLVNPAPVLFSVFLFFFFFSSSGQVWDCLILSAGKGNDSLIKSNRGAKLSVLTSKDKNES